MHRATVAEGIETAHRTFESILANHPSDFHTRPNLRFSHRRSSGVRRRLGYARIGYNEVVLRTHPLSSHPVDQWRETTAHELAHIARYHAAPSCRNWHGPGWRSIAQRYGATGERVVRTRPSDPIWTRNAEPVRPVTLAAPLPAGLAAFSRPRKIFDPATGRYLN